MEAAPRTFLLGTACTCTAFHIRTVITALKERGPGPSSRRHCRRFPRRKIVPMLTHLLDDSEREVAVTGMSLDIVCRPRCLYTGSTDTLKERLSSPRLVLPATETCLDQERLVLRHTEVHNLVHRHYRCPSDIAGQRPSGNDEDNRGEMRCRIESRQSAATPRMLSKTQCCCFTSRD